jgi:2-succinyl-5-enolpyruvyl-6-hydroxy-3-cyclohexene-1-carboxylate synthase
MRSIATGWLRHCKLNNLTVAGRINRPVSWGTKPAKMCAFWIFPFPSPYSRFENHFMSRFQPIYDIAEICSRKGISHAVLCPGSRCAPLTLAFTRHSRITTRTFSDERSAGFIALGMAQQHAKPTILLCTSGSAAYNFAPAVAEAFFNQTPLLVFTADRPAEWIAQHDGQTIYQQDIFGRHVKKSFQLPQDYEHPDSRWAINRIINEAINLTFQEPKGPVHINAPFREPLYPANDEALGFSEDVRTISEQHPAYTLTDEQKTFIQSNWSKFHNILIVAGQHHEDISLLHSLAIMQSRHPIPIVGDIISNLHPIENLIRLSDLFLGQASDALKRTLQPDLVITFGKSVISKNVKLFLRKYAPKAQWHIQPAGAVADTYQHLTHIFKCNPAEFFSFVSTLPSAETFEAQKQFNYHKLWEVQERKALRVLEEYFPQDTLGELELVHEIIRHLPDHCNLHLANSMSVRYANFIGLGSGQKSVTVFANRGTSGIDGCTSTVVGHALANDKPNILITGDLAFFYDRNAFWHNYKLPNLRVVLLNNHGGIIFGMIDGPGTLPESEEYFITRQNLTARKLCEEFDVDYLKLDNVRKLKNLLKDFFDFDGRTKILELETNTTINKTIFENLKQKIKKAYES